MCTVTRALERLSAKTALSVEETEGVVERSSTVKGAMTLRLLFSQPGARRV